MPIVNIDEENLTPTQAALKKAGIKATVCTTNPYPRALPQLKINGQRYFIDERLRQIRNVHNPNDFEDFGKLDKTLAIQFQKDSTPHHMTPNVLEFVIFGKELIEVSEGDGFEQQKIYGITHRRYETDGRWIDIGLGLCTANKHKAFAAARILKQTNLCTNIKTAEEKEVCGGILNRIQWEAIGSSRGVLGSHSGKDSGLRVILPGDRNERNG